MKNLFVLLCLALVACNNSTETSTGDAPKTEVASAVGNADCLVSHADKGTLDQLLPLDAIRKHYNVPEGAQKQYDYRADAKKHDKDVYEYTWDSDRTGKMNVAGREITYPLSNRIGLRWVGSDLFMITGKATPLESFKAFYRNVSAEEKEEAFKKAGELMKEKGYDEKTTETATDMAKDLSADEITFKEITGVGEAASWRIREKELTVLVGERTFQVSVDISSNDEENIELAKKIAQEVLAKCK
jgi:hypothetical protein